MSSFSLEKFIAAPVDKVFSVFSDIDHAAENISGVKRIERLTKGAVGVGTCFKQTRVVLNREATETLEFVTFFHGKSYTVKASFCGEEFVAQVDFERYKVGTTVVVKCQARSLSIMGTIASPLGAVLLKPIRKVFEQDLIDLKAICELQNE